MTVIKNAGTESIQTIATLAKHIWPEAYKNIITTEQISYMLNLFYAEESLLHQINTLKHRFVILYENGIPVGFASYSVKNEKEISTYRLHKLYISTSRQGKGFGKMLIDHIAADIHPQGAQLLELNVNRNNPAFHFYLKNGFTVLREEKLNIGNGYYMDDYVLIKKV